MWLIECVKIGVKKSLLVCNIKENRKPFVVFSTCDPSKMFLRILLFSLLIFVLTWAAGRNCEHSDGYIRNHWDNLTDNCDHECGINVRAGALCLCAGLHGAEQRLEIYNGPNYCCMDPSPDNRTQCFVDMNNYGQCWDGRVKSRKDTCNHHCHNDYEASASVGIRSYYRCGKVPIFSTFCRNQVLHSYFSFLTCQLRNIEVAGVCGMPQNFVVNGFVKPSYCLLKRGP